MGKTCCTTTATTQSGLKAPKAMSGKSYHIDEHTPKSQEALDKYFKGCMTGKQSEQMVFEKLKKMGFNDANTLFADCSCPDEINHDDPLEDITSLMQTRWGEMFPLGGLAGFPFTGKTGWGAFSSHCPNDGNIVVLFAPHVGVDFQGNVGKVTREGQDHATSACGAAIGALAAIKADPNAANFLNGYKDHQMDCIKHLLNEHKDSISKKENEQAALVFKMYEILYDFLDDILQLNWQGPNSKLVLLGGIMINCDGDGTDRFLPLKLEMRQKNKRQDLFKETFGFDVDAPMLENPATYKTQNTDA